MQVAYGYYNSLNRRVLTVLSCVTMSGIRVLFLCANPDGTKRLKLDEEFRAIKEVVDASEYRDLVELIPGFALRSSDLAGWLLKNKPHIVHFSGHGSKSGEVTVVGQSGESQVIEIDALAHLLGTVRDNIRVVVLNACHTKAQADKLSSIFECTICMNEAISDKAATIFSTAFYQAVGFGRSIRTAFDLGISALLMHKSDEAETPQLLVLDGVDACSVVLVSHPRLGNPVLPFWDGLDNNLREVFALAAALAISKEKDYISTTTFFEALHKLQPRPLADMFSRLPSGSLPEPTLQNAPIDVSSLKSIKSLSPCIDSSISKLAPQATLTKKVHSHDMFVDIARYENGKSVRQLRTHGVDKAKIEELFGQLGWHVMERKRADISC